MPSQHLFAVQARLETEALKILDYPWFASRYPSGIHRAPPLGSRADNLPWLPMGWREGAASVHSGLLCFLKSGSDFMWPVKLVFYFFGAASACKSAKSFQTGIAIWQLCYVMLPFGQWCYMVQGSLHVTGSQKRVKLHGAKQASRVGLEVVSGSVSAYGGA